MKKLDIEQSIRNTIAHDTPDLFDKIIATPVKKMESEDYIVKTYKKEHRSGRFRFITAVCTSMVLLIAVCLGFMQGYPVYANDSVYIDINPGFKIVTNISGKVTSLEGTNPDGEHVVSNISYKNKNYHEVLAESLQEAKQLGYITVEHENVILVSVKSQSNKRCDSIKETAVTDIEDNLSNDNMAAVVYSQKLEETNQLVALANEYNISTGKAQFIMSLINIDPSLTVAELADLSLQELEALSVEKNIDLAGLVDCNKDTDTANNNNTSSPDTSDVTTQEIVVPKQDDSTDAGITAETTTSAESTTSAPSNTNSAGSTTSTENTEVGTAVPKTACDTCDSSCSCPNCSTGCKAGCPDCDTNCSNSKNPGKAPESTTEAATTEEDEEIFESKDTEDLLIFDPEGLDETNGTPVIEQ